MKVFAVCKQVGDYSAQEHSVVKIVETEEEAKESVLVLSKEYRERVGTRWAWHDMEYYTYEEVEFIRHGN